MELTDTHAHLYLPEFRDNLQEVVAAARRAGVARVFLPNIDVGSMDAVDELARLDPGFFYPMMGLHPCSVREDFRDQLGRLRARLEPGGYLAVGEIGIDMYWDKSTLPWQVEAFEEQIRWAKELSLPVVIHARESFNEIFEVLDRVNDASLSGVFHCFTGTADQARKIMDYGGFMMGAGGVITYPKAALDQVYQSIPMEYIVLETDSPYLTPVPHRGKRNESAYVRIVAEKLSQIKGIAVEEVAELTTANSRRLFGI